MHRKVATSHRRGELQGPNQQGGDPSADVQQQPDAMRAVMAAERLRAGEKRNKVLKNGVPDDEVKGETDDDRPQTDLSYAGDHRNGQCLICQPRHGFLRRRSI